MKGTVCLAGAGPGDPGLVSSRALEWIRRADAIVYDRLVSPQLIAMARPDAELVYVGKASSQHTMRQEEINLLLVKLAKENKAVLRLKGGDPFVFGRGGEEAIVLRENGIQFEIVPGITSAIAVAAYAGIPVTHRGIATSFAVVTGQAQLTTVAEEQASNPFFRAAEPALAKAVGLAGAAPGEVFAALREAKNRF